MLVAPPGAGKTTRIPPALLGEPWLENNQVLLLQPRRIAARTAAQRMARERNEAAGETFGWRVRHDHCTSQATRVEVLTEGLFLRRLQGEPDLPGVGAVIFDEFHERNLHADLALALLLEARQALRPDLRIIVMSATLAAEPVAEMLQAPILQVDTAEWPVETHYLVLNHNRLEERVATAIGLALETAPGDVLTFLPGVPEIRRVSDLLSSRKLPGTPRIQPLHGSLPLASQDQVIQPPPAGERRVILATSIAETSLTIPGIHLVIDAGLSRRQRYDPATGLSRLETQTVSRDCADQRRGRAGRTAPGICWRLWSESADRGLVETREPEVACVDLCGLVLELAAWGNPDPTAYAWLTPPPETPLAQARSLLTDMGALDEQVRITAIGRKLVELPLHPRLARMVLWGQEQQQAGLAVLLAAMLEERDVFLRQPGKNRSVDLRPRLRAWWNWKNRIPVEGLHEGICHAIRRSEEQLRQKLGTPQWDGDDSFLGGLIAQAWPERIAMQRRSTRVQYLLASGRGARVSPADALAGSPFLAVVEVDAGEGEGWIRQAVALDEEELRQVRQVAIEDREWIEWDDSKSGVQAVQRESLGAIILKERPLNEPSLELVTAAVCDGIRRLGLESLPWNREIRDWRERVCFLRGPGGQTDFPDLSDSELLATLEEWLAPFLSSVRRKSHFPRIDLAAALAWRLPPDGQQRLQQLAPSYWVAPTGSRLRLEYHNDGPPVLAVRVQEMFGTTVTPTVCNGRIPVLLHLLSPARRPVQITRDLAGFWQSIYPEVRKDLRGRYPRHPWPEDPLQALPVRK